MGPGIRKMRMMYAYVLESRDGARDWSDAYVPVGVPAKAH
jgi:hypothetical protein